MKLKKLLPKKSKRGVTLVEAVFAVVILAIFATGVLTLLTTGRTKIAETNRAANTYAEATQVMDGIVAAISNGNYVKLDGTLRLDEEEVTVDGTATAIPGIFDVLDHLDESEITLAATPDYFEKSDGSDMDHTAENTRGWYLSLSYKGITVKGYASNTQGVFDR